MRYRADILKNKHTFNRYAYTLILILLFLAYSIYIFGHFDSENIRKDRTIPYLKIRTTEASWKIISELHDRSIQTGSREYKKTYVPCVVTFEGKEYSAKLRLKGSTPFHLENSKWSLRVKLAARKKIKNSRYFDIEHPASQFFSYDKIFRDHLTMEGLMSNNMDFVDVSINGDFKGLMAMITPISLKARNIPKSTILRSDNEIAEYRYLYRSSKRNWRARPAIPNTNYHDKKQRKKLAVSLMRGWQYGNIATSEVFDVPSLSKYLAISELWGAWHNTEWEDMNYYFNPYTLTFFPISIDPATLQSSHKGGVVNLLECPDKYPSVTFLRDPLIRKEFMREIKRLTDNSYLQNILTSIDKQDAGYKKLFLGEFRFLPPSPSVIIRSRAEVLSTISENSLEYKIHYPQLLKSNYQDPYVITKYKKSVYPPIETFPPSVLSEIVTDENGKSTIILHNGMPDNLSFNYPSQFPCGYDSDLIIRNIRIHSPSQEVLLSSESQRLEIGKPLYFILPDSFTEHTQSIKLHANAFFGSFPERLIEQKVRKGINPSSIHPYSELILKHTVPEFLLKTAKDFIIPSGVWEINAPLIIPDGKNLKIEAGAKVTFDESAFILAINGNLQIDGDIGNSVVLQGKNGKNWGGILILNQGTSYCKNARIHGISIFEIPEIIKLNHGFTIYAGDYGEQNCEIAKNKGTVSHQHIGQYTIADHNFN